MQRATLEKSGSKKASQLQGRTAIAFSSNSQVMTTATQSFGSQDYHRQIHDVKVLAFHGNQLDITAARVQMEQVKLEEFNLTGMKSTED